MANIACVQPSWRFEFASISRASLMIFFAVGLPLERLHFDLLNHFSLHRHSAVAILLPRLFIGEVRAGHKRTDWFSSCGYLALLTMLRDILSRYWRKFLYLNLGVHLLHFSLYHNLMHNFTAKIFHDRIFLRLLRHICQERERIFIKAFNPLLIINILWWVSFGCRSAQDTS